MSDNIKAGVVVINRFCNSGAGAFSSYINYIDRNEAKRQEKLSEYNLYNDYMDSPEKTTGLFTRDKEKLTLQEKKELKQSFITAQKNGSLMWQSIISFDNRWLEKYGLYDSATGIVDERKIKELGTGAINKMLENEGMENAVWSGAIHYNTDNLHIHVAIVEPVPQRKKKAYKQYTYQEDMHGKYVKDAYGCYVHGNKKFVAEMIQDGIPVTRYRKEPVLDQDGNVVEKVEYVGRFLPKSIEMCKQHVVNNIILDKELNLKLNKIVREKIVGMKKEYSIAQDADLRNKFLEIHSNLPKSGNRGLWNYNNNAMERLRPQIDELSELYMSKYNKPEYDEFRKMIRDRAEEYKLAYGHSTDSSRDYEENKMRDLYSRLGNAILKEMKIYDKSLSEEERNALSDDGMQIIMGEDAGDLQEDNEMVLSDWQLEDDYDIEQDLFLPEAEFMEWGLRWTDEYKKARNKIYGKNKDYEKGIDGLRAESIKGNVLAVFELGNIYKYGKGVDINLDKAESYYKESMKMLKKLLNDYDEMRDREKGSRGYILYRIGKQTFYGQGTDINYQEALNYFKKAVENGNKYACYNLAGMYYDGKGTEVDLKRSYQLYEEALKIGRKKDVNPYAAFKLGFMNENGYGCSVNKENANSYYKVALNKFLKMEKTQPDDNLEYRIGTMYYGGKGTEQSVESAKHYFELASESGNARAKYKLAMMEIEEKQGKDIGKALEGLQELAVKGNDSMAQYALGNIYSKEEGEYYDILTAEKWLLMAADNKSDMAMEKLGKLYGTERGELYNLDKSYYFYNAAVERNNEVAKYGLGKLHLKEKYFDRQRAIALFSEIGESNKFAQYELGKIYSDKRTPEYDLSRAIEYYEKAAERGHGAAEFRLGLIYLDKNNGYYDERKGVKYLEDSVEHGCQYGLVRLGSIYLDKESQFFDLQKGISIMQSIADSDDRAKYVVGKTYLDNTLDIYDCQKGIKYLTESAESGNEYANLKLGIVYLQGEKNYPGITADREMAKVYLQRAVEMGNELAEDILKNMDKKIFSFSRKERGKSVRGHGIYALERALLSLKKSCKEELQKSINIREYEKLKEKEEKEREKDEIDKNEDEA